MTARFFTELDTRRIEGPLKELLAPFSGYSERYDLTWCAPRRFRGDEASVPRAPVAYWLYGGRGYRGAWPHDMGYGWPFDSVTRVQWDFIFHEANAVEHTAMRDQEWYRRLWRWSERGVMAGTVLAVGWAATSNYPGCLDRDEAKRRKCPQDKEPRCLSCKLYYRQWRGCVRKGYHPELWREHV